MAGPARDLGDASRLVELVVADPPAAWEAAGFALTGGVVRVGDTAIRPVASTGEPAPRVETGVDGRAGILGWTVAGLDLPPGSSTLDGLPTVADHAGTDADTDADAERRSDRDGEQGAMVHPNGATKIDHVVVVTPDLERTIAAFEATGLGCRRMREAGTAARPMRQAFFRLGPTVVEVVAGGPGKPGGGAGAADGVPATWFGIAVDVADIDVTAALLGDDLGRVKAAVQPGRRIATLRHRRLGLSVATAVMDDHGDR